MQERARKDALADSNTGTAAEEQKEEAEPYLPPSDPSFLIGKRPEKQNKEEFVPDFDVDEVPPLE